MSIFDADELGNMNVCRFETQLGAARVRFTTPRGKCKATLDLGEGRPREWEERKGPGLSGATLVSKGAGLCSGTLTIEYFPDTEAERALLRLDRDSFVAMVGSPAQGSPDKVFTINHPVAMSLSTPMTACVFLNDSPLKHDENKQLGTDVFKIKEFRKQLPTISSTTAPGGATREGQSIDLHEAEKKERLGELEGLSAELKALP